jgi:hypothetical protein
MLYLSENLPYSIHTADGADFCRSLGDLLDLLVKRLSVTCTRVLAFREILGICATKNPCGFSLLQVRAATVRGMRPNAPFLAVRLVTSLTLTT